MTKSSTEGENPEKVLDLPELFQSLDFIDAILEGDVPAKYPVRFTNTVSLFYSFVGSSGRGFSGSFGEANLPYVAIDIGVWNTSEEDERPYNWKKLGNLVVRVEARTKKGELHLSLVFIFTDNTTVEDSIAKGNSASELLLMHVCRLRRLQIRHCFTLHVIHASGTRMIHQGIFGLSR